MFNYNPTQPMISPFQASQMQQQQRMGQAPMMQNAQLPPQQQQPALQQVNGALGLQSPQSTWQQAVGMVDNQAGVNQQLQAAGHQPLSGGQQLGAAFGLNGYGDSLKAGAPLPNTPLANGQMTKPLQGPSLPIGMLNQQPKDTYAGLLSRIFGA